MTRAGQRRRRPIRLFSALEHRTLRFRVLAALVGLVATACLVLGAATAFGLHTFLLRQLDQRLQTAGARYTQTLATRDREPRNAGSDNDGDFDSGFGDERGQAVGTLGARIKNGRLSNLGVVGRTSPPQLSPTAQRSLLALPVARPVSRYLTPIGEYRVLASRGPGQITAITGLPLTPVDDTMDRLLLVEAATFGALLAVAAGVGWWLVRLSLRPLARVTSTARKVSEAALDDSDALSHRVPEVEPGTEVGQLGQAFNTMLDHVEGSLKARAATEERLRRFIADASHELRTPVASIRAHAESTRRSDVELPPAVGTALRRIEAEAVRMGVLVDDLLLLARLDAGRPLAREPVDLTRLVIDTTNDARAAHPDHRWRLELPETEMVVTGDDFRLHQVLSNLLTNAARHTPAGCTVTVSLRRQAGSALLTVTDDGPGIAADRQPMLFERFFRGDTADAGPGAGSGLGLAIVAAVSKAHGGSVAVDSQPGRTTFTVSLPAGGADLDEPSDSDLPAVGSPTGS